MVYADIFRGEPLWTNVVCFESSRKAEGHYLYDLKLADYINVESVPTVNTESRCLPDEWKMSATEQFLITT